MEYENQPPITNTKPDSPLVTWSIGGMPDIRNDRPPRLSDYCELQEILILIDEANAPPLLLITRNEYKDSLHIRSPEQTSAQIAELDAVELHCPQCGSPLTNTSFTFCNTCKSMVRWSGRQPNSTITLLGKQLYLLDERITHMHYLEKRGYDRPILTHYQISLPHLRNTVLMDLLLAVKTAKKDNTESVHAEKLVCPACGAALLHLNRCSHCNSLVLYTENTFSHLDGKTTQELTQLIATKSAELIAIARNKEIYEAQIIGLGGPEYAVQIKRGTLEKMNIMFEEARITINYALIILKSRNEGISLEQLIKNAPKAYTTLRINEQLNSSAVVARCVSCAGGIDSTIGRSEVGANMFECQYCGAAQDFGSKEVTQELQNITIRGIDTQIENAIQFIKRSKSQIEQQFTDIHDFYSKSFRADGAQYYDMCVRYVKLVKWRNKLAESLNRLNGPPLIQRVALLPELATLPPKPPFFST